MKYKNLGGTHRTKTGKIIKPGQFYEANPDDISEAFRDVQVPVKKIPPIEVLSEPVNGKTDFEIKNAGSGWYNVVNKTTGKILNEKKLRLEDAKKLLSELE